MEESGGSSCFVLLWSIACHTHGFSRDAQLKVTVKTSCRNKAFFLYMMYWKSPMASYSWQNSCLNSVLCVEEPNAEFLQQNHKKLLKLSLELIKGKSIFSFVCLNTATVAYPNSPSPAPVQCALQLRGPDQASLCLTSLCSGTMGKHYGPSGKTTWAVHIIQAYLRVGSSL